MAEINFPTSPTNGQSFSAGDITYVYNAAKGRWNAAPNFDSITATLGNYRTNGTLTASPADTPVPKAQNDSSSIVNAAINAQAQALFNRQEKLKQDLSSSTGSGIVGFKHPATFAVQRTVSSKLSDNTSLKDFGAVGDGTSNDVSAINTAIQQFSNVGGGTLSFSSSAQYAIGRPYSGSQRGISLLPGVDIRGNSTKIILQNNCEFFYLGRSQDRGDTTFVSFYGISAGGDYAQTDVSFTAGSTTIPVISGQESAFAAGDLVYYRYGQADYDYAEPAAWGFAKVISTAAGSVTLDRPIDFALVPTASTTGDTTSGNSTIANLASITDIVRWMIVTGTGIPANTYVGSVGVNSVTLVDSSGNAVNASATGTGVSLTFTMNSRQRRLIKLSNIPENFHYSGFNLQNPASGSANAEGGFHIRYARNGKFSNINAKNVGPGILVAQFAENIALENIHLEGCVNQGQASKGRMSSIGESRNISFKNWSAENFQGTLHFVEAGTENIKFVNGSVVNNYSGRSSSSPIFYLAGGKDLIVDGLKLDGNPAMILDSSSNGNLKPPFLFNVEASTTFAPSFGTLSRWFDVDWVGENVKLGNIFYFTRKRRFTMEITVLASQGYKSFMLPNGVHTSIKMMVTNKTGITSLAVANSGGANPVPSAGGTSQIAAMTANTMFTYPKTNAYPWWSFGTGHPYTNPANQKYVAYISDGAVVAGTKLYVEIEYFPAASATVQADIQTHMITQ